MITEAAIRKTIREVEAGKKTAATLADPAPRGAGRLVLIVKPGRAEWYAQRWNAGRRTLQKLGAWPGMGIATARDQHAGVGRTITPERSGHFVVGQTEFVLNCHQFSWLDSHFLLTPVETMNAHGLAQVRKTFQVGKLIAHATLQKIKSPHGAGC